MDKIKVKIDKQKKQQNRKQKILKQKQEFPGAASADMILKQSGLRSEILLN